VVQAPKDVQGTAAPTTKRARRSHPQKEPTASVLALLCCAQPSARPSLLTSLHTNCGAHALNITAEFCSDCRAQTSATPLHQLPIQLGRQKFAKPQTLQRPAPFYMTATCPRQTKCAICMQAQATVWALVCASMHTEPRVKPPKSCSTLIIKCAQHGHRSQQHHRHQHLLSFPYEVSDQLQRLQRHFACRVR